MNEILANNVRRLREIKNWTQEHLAQAAGVQLRTVQRIEAAQGASADTLAALANGFDTSVDLLRTDFDDLIRKAREMENELAKTHAFVEMMPVTCSGDLAAIAGSDASLMQCKSRSDEAQNVFAELETEIGEAVDVWSDLDPVTRRSYLSNAYGYVEGLNALGLVVSVGKRSATLVHANGTCMPFTTLYLIAWAKDEVRARIAVEKNAVPSLG